MQIDSYSFGSMTVDGRAYNSDLIIFPDKVKSNWWRKGGHSLAIDDLGEIIGYKPDLLIVGKGAAGAMEIPASTREFLKEQHTELIDKNTDEATRLFNEEVKKEKIVIGAFHLTC